MSFHFDRSRLMSFCPTADIEGLKEQMIGFDRVATGNLREGGPIAGLEAHERFRWLTAVRSASLQTSRPHAGLTHDLEKTFKDLYASLVM